MSLRDYVRKRRFDDTPEPNDESLAPWRKRSGARRPIFVVQLHHASVRHYDFRLEVDGVLKSWAVPKGPSLRPGEKRLAVEVEDHPLAYAEFEGDIPKGNYGAGHVDVFDRGEWTTLEDPLAALAAGKLDFELFGNKLRGGWKLVRSGRDARRPQWLLFKRNDKEARDATADDLIDSAAAKPKATKPAAARKTRAAATTTRAPSSRRRPAKAIAAKAAALAGARSRPLAADFRPQLATLRTATPRGDDWLHEVKWDGYRLLASSDDGGVRLRSRNGLDWSEKFPEIARAIAALPGDGLRLDGELVALDSEGRSDFSALQRDLERGNTSALRYLLFDLPGVAGWDLSQVPLVERKGLLEELLAGHDGGVLALSRHIVGHGEKVFAASMKQGVEGIVSKRLDAPYVAERTPTWIKSKHESSDEFVVVGYTQPKGSRSAFGSLLMATREQGKLRYVGRVGSGYDDATLKSMHARLLTMERKLPTVALPAHVPFSPRSVHWVEPQLVVEVAFRGWGKEGLLRQAAFKRLRIDKSNHDVESAAPVTDRISSPDRVVYRSAGITKGRVAEYYRTIAPWILPELARRPLSLLRCPDGADATCFFQKHHAGALGKHVLAVALRQKSGVEDYLYVDDVEGLLDLVQMNTLEFHPWGSRVDAPEQPDRLVLDLDPDPGIGWPAIVAAARDVRARLEETGLESFVRLSGGKGLHVVAPIARGPDWSVVRHFCESFARALAEHRPDTYVATMSKAKRKGRIFIDWLRNARGATSVTSWSLRAREGAPAAVPLRWQDLGRTRAGNEFDLAATLKRIRRLTADPWEGIDNLRQALPED